MTREPHLFGELAPGRIEQFLRHRAAMQLLGNGRPERRPRTPRSGDRATKGCRDRIPGRPFRVVASCPAPKNRSLRPSNCRI